MLPYSLVYIAYYFVFINSLAFITFGLDKYFAKNDMRRISENNLLLMAILGGPVGAIIAQHSLRHKTRKQPLKARLYSIAIIQFVLIAAFLVAGTL